MESTKKTYRGQQYDDVEKLMDDAERLVANPNTRKEGTDLMRLADLRIKREVNRLVYARQTGQMPVISALEPGKSTRQIEA